MPYFNLRVQLNGNNIKLNLSLPVDLKNIVFRTPQNRIDLSPTETLFRKSIKRGIPGSYFHKYQEIVSAADQINFRVTTSVVSAYYPVPFSDQIIPCNFFSPLTGTHFMFGHPILSIDYTSIS